MIGRYAVAIAIGAGITLALLFIMQFLIAVSGGAISEVTNTRIVDFVRVERESVVDSRRDRPDKPPEPERPPEMPNPDQNRNFDTALAVSIGTPNIGADLNLGGLGFGITDGEYLPMVHIAPAYPQRAAQRGLEGWAIVEFVVTRTGSTRDIGIVESSNPIFERPAMDAASRFRYRPRVIDGEPIDVPGVRYRFTFVLED